MKRERYPLFYAAHFVVFIFVLIILSQFQDDADDKKRRKKREEKEKKEKKRHKKDRDGKFLPKVGVKELVNRLEPKLFQDAETGTKMVMDKTVATSVIAKQKKVSSKISDAVAGQIMQQQQQQRVAGSSLGQQQQQQQQTRRPDPPVIVHDAGNPNQVGAARVTFFDS